MKGLLSTVLGLVALGVSPISAAVADIGTTVEFGGVFSEFDNGVKMTLDGSSCYMIFDLEPYSVKCDLVINAVDKGGKTEFVSKSVVGASFTTALDGTVSSATIEYKAAFPSVDATYNSAALIPMIEVPEKGTRKVTSYETKNVPQVCVGNIMKFFPADASSYTATNIADKTGSDMCIKLTVSSSVSDGSKLRLIATFNYLNPALAVTTSAGLKVTKFAAEAGLNKILSKQINIGMAIVDNVRNSKAAISPVVRMLSTDASDGLLDDSGNFLFGNAAPINTRAKKSGQIALGVILAILALGVSVFVYFQFFAKKGAAGTALATPSGASKI